LLNTRLDAQIAKINQSITSLQKDTNNLNKEMEQNYKLIEKYAKCEQPLECVYKTHKYLGDGKRNMCDY